MQSLNKNLIISFNGEIYNHLQIRDKINKIKMLNGDQILILKLYWYQLRHLELKKHSKILLECLHLHLLIKIKNKLIWQGIEMVKRPLLWISW